MRRKLTRSALPDAAFARETSEFDRSLGFFDATYAFALTLLVVNIDLPPAASWASLGTLWDALNEQLLGFVISFCVIVMFWLANSGIISRLRVLDRSTVMLNIVVIGFVVLIPFTTQAISDPTLYEYPLPVVIYALNVALPILVQAFMYEQAMGRGHGRLVRSPRTQLMERIDAVGTPVVFLLSIPVAFIDSVAARFVWILLIPVGMITGRLATRAELDDLEASRADPDAAGPDTAAGSGATPAQAS